MQNCHLNTPDSLEQCILIGLKSLTFYGLTVILKESKNIKKEHLAGWWGAFLMWGISSTEDALCPGSTPGAPLKYRKRGEPE